MLPRTPQNLTDSAIYSPYMFLLLSAFRSPHGTPTRRAAQIVAHIPLYLEVMAVTS